jgi:colanic acid/amylovoran biosynthesis protein
VVLTEEILEDDRVIARPDVPAMAILGASLDVGNRGVRALGVATAQLIAQVCPKNPIVFFYGNATGGVRRLSGGVKELELIVRNCRLAYRSDSAEHIFVILTLAVLHRIGIRGPAKRNPWLSSLLAAEFVGDIRGGDSFSDIYGCRRFVLGSLPLLSAVVMRRSFVMLPQTYGPFRNHVCRALAKMMLSRADSILTRDKNCEGFVHQLCGRTPTFCPDVAFTLEAKRPAHPKVILGGLDVETEKFVIGLNVSGLLYMGGYTGRNMFGLCCDYRKLVDELTETLLASTDAKILFVPHVFGSEREEEACASLVESAASRYPGRVFTLRKSLSEQEVKWVIGKTDFFIGSRMHACIAALSQCVPAVGLAYSDKFLGVFQSAGVGAATIDLRKVELNGVVDQVLSALAKRSETAEELSETIPGIREQVRKTFRDLLGTDCTISADQMTA